MKLYLVRRWGSNQPGSTVSVEDEAQARWLLDHNFAQRTKTSDSASSGAAAPGSDGPDPRAGGDGTRRRPTSMKSSDTRENRAWPVAGSPVQYNAGVAPTQGAGGGNDEGSESGQEESGEGSTKSARGRRKPS